MAMDVSEKKKQEDALKIAKKDTNRFLKIHLMVYIKLR